MTCKRVKKWLPLYVGDELGPWRRRVVEHHFRCCHACAREHAHLAKSRNLVSGALLSQSGSVSGDALWKHVLSGLRRERPASDKPHRISSPWRVAVPALVGAALVCIVTFLGERLPDQKSLHRNEEGSIPIPVVESVNQPGVTVMTFLTDDPKVTIVWFFEEEPNS